MFVIFTKYIQENLIEFSLVLPNYFHFNSIR